MIDGQESDKDQTSSSYLNSLSPEGRYRLLVEAVTDYAIYMLDPSGIVSSWNPGARRFKGYAAEEIVGQHFSRFYTDEDRASGLPARALRIAAADGTFESEGWRVRKDGSRFWASVVIDAIRTTGGDLVGFAKITRDLTERRAAGEELRRSEERFRLLVQAVTDYAIYMLDPGGVITNWNAGAERIKGYREDEIVGRHFGVFYTPEDRAAGAPATALATAAAEGRFEKEAWRVRKDGSRFWASVVIDPIRSANGDLIGFAKVTRDITERRAAQEELERTREQLFQAQKMEAIGQLTGGIAHDFNNLLTVVIGALEGIRRAGTDIDRIKRNIDLATTGAQRAASLTSRLLAFSRRQPLEPTPLDLNRLVRDMTELLHRTLGERIELEGVLSSRLWLTEIDRNQLESAVLNLALNARDAMPEGGKLTIETANVDLDDRYVAAIPEPLRAGQYVVVGISDTGKGIGPEALARVFEPFFTTKPTGQGTGLGLSMVYGFVKQSGGHVTIYSEPGHGTSVRMYFPRYFGTAEMEAIRDLGPIPQAVAGEVVLVVEDSEDVRAYSAGALRELGYAVIEAPSAEAALTTLRSDGRVDLLFTDVVLPGMTGAVLAQQALGLRPRLGVLFTTGYSRNAIVHHGRVDPGVSLLSKPFTFDQLARKVRELLDGEGGRPTA
ncbi:MAG: PAS domain S-box protein [Bauldia sp.]